MRVSVLSVVILAASAYASNSNDLWSKFETTRQGARALHQEFEITRHVKTASREQSLHYRVVIDISEGKWRERAIGGGGELTRVFDGQELLVFEQGATDYTRTKQKDELLPQPYGTKVDWGKTKEIQRLPCGFSVQDHTCVIIEAPVKSWMRSDTNGRLTRMLNGTSRMMIDTETGIWLAARTTELVEAPRTNYQTETSYQAKQMTFGRAADAALFGLPNASFRQVKELSPWDEARIKKQLVGKPAPDLQVIDIRGRTVSLADLRGKTVLLDFWTTWCPPCQADAPSIEKLNEKYGSRNLAVVGISVSEDRETVEGYLKKHPHNYPVVLSTENQLPRPYQIGVFPTYLIISPDGTLMTAAEGDQGFGKLRKDLQKAGLEIE
jgi:thiol-disulfide isomerase/thioredoxin